MGAIVLNKTHWDDSSFLMGGSKISSSLPVLWSGGQLLLKAVFSFSAHKSGCQIILTWLQKNNRLRATAKDSSTPFSERQSTKHHAIFRLAIEMSNSLRVSAGFIGGTSHTETFDCSEKTFSWFSLWNPYSCFILPLIKAFIRIWFYLKKFVTLNQTTRWTRGLNKSLIGPISCDSPYSGLSLSALFYRLTRKRVYELLKTNLIMHDIFLQLILNILFDCSCSTCYVIDFLRHSFDLNPLCFRVWLPDLPHFTTQDFFLLLKLFIYLRSN